jgi:hypothetical protein
LVFDDFGRRRLGTDEQQLTCGDAVEHELDEQVAVLHCRYVASVRHLSRNPVKYGPALPEGAVLIVVYIDRSGPVRQQVCDGVITDGQRRWKSEGIAT